MNGSNVICPLHQWDYDVRTGISRWNSDEQVAVYPVRVEGQSVQIDADAVPPKPRFEGEYLSLWARRDDPLEHEMHDIHVYAKGRHEIVEPMGSERRTYPSFDELYFLPGQLAHPPLLDDESVSTEVVIGDKREKPLRLRAPIFVSHMSFGALSKEAKMALAKGAALFGTMICSSEGGMLDDERALADQYVFEMASGYFGWMEENIAHADGIEIKMGQSAKAGLGGLLPGSKVTADIARMRGLQAGQDARSPARFPDIHTISQMQERILSAGYARSTRPSRLVSSSPPAASRRTLPPPVNSMSIGSHSMAEQAAPARRASTSRTISVCQPCMLSPLPANGWTSMACAT